MAVFFVFALLLPMSFGTQVSAPTSALDFLNGFSRFNLSLAKLGLPPLLGLALTVAVFADPTVNRLFGLLVLVVVMLLVVAAITIGATRRPKPPLQTDDGLDYADRMRRLEDQIATPSARRRRR